MSYYDEGGNMGYYIETNGVKNKAEFIVKNYGGIRVTRPSNFNQIASDEALITVVDNGMFEAAALIYDEGEFDAFVNDFSDPRRHEFVLMNKQKAYELAGYKPRN
jgi:hypothetical protein